MKKGMVVQSTHFQYEGMRLGDFKKKKNNVMRIERVCVSGPFVPTVQPQLNWSCVLVIQPL